MKAILFDLDGTLLPMDQDAFTTGYFRDLYKAFAAAGIKMSPEDLTKAVWAGTKAMVKNDGSMRNREAFWNYFSTLTGIDRQIAEPLADRFYSHEFLASKRFTGENPLAAEAVSLAHKTGCKVVLASNPLFPLVGHITRMSWVGLKPEDFDLITSYESDSFCKPNPDYYRTICERLELDPSECLMIGNDETEDMFAGTAAGLHTWLVTDCMIPAADRHWDGPKGTFAELIEYLKTL